MEHSDSEDESSLTQEQMEKLAQLQVQIQGPDNNY